MQTSMKTILLLAVLGLFIDIEAATSLNFDDNDDVQQESLIAQTDALREVASHTQQNMMVVSNWLLVRCHCRNADGDSDSDSDGDRSASCALVNDEYEFAKWNTSDTVTENLEHAAAWLQGLKLQFGVTDSDVSDKEARLAWAFMTAVGGVAMSQCQQSRSEQASATLQAVIFRDADGWTLDLNTGIYRVQSTTARTHRRSLSRQRRSAADWSANPYANQNGFGGRLTYDGNNWSTNANAHYNIYSNQWSYGVGASYNFDRNSQVYGSYSSNGNWEVGLRLRW